jgi:hypothetical protein
MGLKAARSRRGGFGQEDGQRKEPGGASRRALMTNRGLGTRPDPHPAMAGRPASWLDIGSTGRVGIPGAIARLSTAGRPQSPVVAATFETLAEFILSLSKGSLLRHAASSPHP